MSKLRIAPKAHAPEAPTPPSAPPPAPHAEVEAWDEWRALRRKVAVLELAMTGVHCEQDFNSDGPDKQSVDGLVFHVLDIADLVKKFEDALFGLERRLER